MWLSYSCVNTERALLTEQPVELAGRDVLYSLMGWARHFVRALSGVLSDYVNYAMVIYQKE